MQVLVCGSPDRGDDGAAIVAAGRLGSAARRRASLAVVGQLTPDGLLDAVGRGPVLVLDAATGIDAGAIVEMPFEALRTRAGALRPRSSHELPVPDIVGLVELLLGRVPDGAMLVVGGGGFELGAALSPPVAAAVPAYVARIEEAIDRLGRS